ncbi:SDR family NAD(P)-dependent oxidoreductase [Flavobacterium pokkalii]|nr:SDR family NAD(P)-dependent oxidoreductase [Flavobacterium pokkalii]
MNKNINNIVMTGVSSGIGLHAINKITKQLNTKIIVGARDCRKKMPENVQIIPLDLASLSSVRTFAEQLIKELNGGIDLLVLNAGMQNVASNEKSEDGYELTFAVNHLAHYLLIQLLLPHMSTESRIIITTSDTHDPAVTPIAPKILDVQELTYPSKSGFGSGIRAYASSKLCNILTAFSLSKLEQIKTKHIRIIAFNPGFTVGTSLGRNASFTSKMIMYALIHTVFRIISLFKPEYVMSTPEKSGGVLADICLETLRIPADKIYISLVKGKPSYPEPSELAKDAQAQIELWEKSHTLVQLNTF